MSYALSDGERKLRLALLQRAIEDAKGNGCTNTSRHRALQLARIREDALDWIRSQSRAHPLTFERICCDFGVPPARARARLLRRLGN